MTGDGAQRRRSGLAARKGLRGHSLLAGVGALLSLAVVGSPGVEARDGTPAARDTIVTPTECTVAPRPEDELRALFRETAATPIPASLEASPAPAAPPAGTPADAETVAAVTATWREYLACLSAGDQARMFALLSDAMVRRQFVVDIAFGVTEDALFAYLAATPIPMAPDQTIPIAPFTDVRVLPDGRVAAVGPDEQGRGDVRIFVKAGDRWLLDDWYDLA
jgi:hypothetical protein